MKKQLKEDIRKGILESVPVGEAMEWCTRMVVVARKPGQPRRTVDYLKLNTTCRRKTHHTHTVRHGAWHSLPHLQDYSGCRRAAGSLLPSSHHGAATGTIEPPWVSVLFLMMHTPEDLTTPRKLKCVDDTLLFVASVEDALWHAYSFLETCAVKGITLKPEKFKFSRREVDLLGFHVGWDP